MCSAYVCSAGNTIVLNTLYFNYVSSSASRKDPCRECVIEQSVVDRTECLVCFVSSNNRRLFQLGQTGLS